MKFYPRTTIAGHFTGMEPVDPLLRPQPEAWVRWATHSALMDENQQMRAALEALRGLIEDDIVDEDEALEIIGRALEPGDGGT